MASGRFVRAHELRRSSNTLLQELTTTGEPCYITEDGKAKAVLLDISRYNAIMDLLEESESPHEPTIGDETRKHVSVRGIISSSGRLMRRRRP